MVVPYLACMLAAAGARHIPARILPSIQAVEGGYTGSVHANADGSADLGVRQINTRWLQPLAATITAWGHRPNNTAEAARLLIWNPCVNIQAAALILQAEYVWAGRDWIAAVGNYHSHTPALHRAYLARATDEAYRLFGPAG